MDSTSKKNNNVSYSIDANYIDVPVEKRAWLDLENIKAGLVRAGKSETKAQFKARSDARKLWRKVSGETVGRDKAIPDNSVVDGIRLNKDTGFPMKTDKEIFKLMDKNNIARQQYLLNKTSQINKDELAKTATDVSHAKGLTRMVDHYTHTLHTQSQTVILLMECV